MAKLFTPNDLIRFIFHETSAEEEAQLRLQLSFDSSLLAQYQQLLESVSLLNDVKWEPSETSVNLILEYSREQIEEASHA